ncbi:MAG: alpha/beta hydrolase [Polyangiales bacterium]
MPLNLDEAMLRGTSRVLTRLPEGLARRLFGRRPRSPEGHVLDAALFNLLIAAKRVGVADATLLPLDDARIGFERSLRLTDRAPRRGLEVRDLTLTETPAPLRVRVYRPHVRVSPSPAVVYFHGGGFVLGSLDSHNDLCRLIAERTRAVVLSVDYRLAPEHVFPVAVEDALAAFNALRARAPSMDLDPGRFAVAGDSAGGNLAAVTANALAGPQSPIAQWLIYPATDFTRSHASHQTFADALVLPKRSIDRFLFDYTPDPATHLDPRASPLFADDLRGVAPAIVQTAGFDPLRDEGDAYARKLADAGVPVSHRCEHTLLHGYAHLGGLVPAANEALDWGCALLRARLHG